MGKAISKDSIRIKFLVIVMWKKKGILLIGIMLALFLSLGISGVNAHTPGPMTLSYGTDTDILTVTVVHVTADPSTHYIYEIVIEKNSVQVDIKTYTNQSDSSQVVETFTVVAEDGDVLEATAKCSVSGQVTNQITIGPTTSSGSSPTPGASDPLIWPLLIATVIIAAGIVMVILVVIKRR